MKLPLALTVVILAAGSIWGVRENQYLTRIREQHRLVVTEAAALGVSTNPSKSSVVTKAGKREREDSTRKAKEFAERLVSFAKEMKEMETSGKQPDEAMQKRIMEMMDGMMSLNGAELKILIAELKGRTDMDDEMRQGMLSFSIMMLAQQHPETALALFTESSDMMGDNPMSKHALSSALSQWAKDQPLAALEWIKKNEAAHPDLVNDEARAAVIAGAARSDFGLALQLIGELKVSADRVLSQIVMVAVTPEQQSELLAALRKQAANTTDKSEGDELLSKGVRGLFLQVAQSGYDKTMAWLESADLSATESGSMAEGLNYYQTKADTGKWLDWISTQTMDGTQSENVTRNLMREWTSKDYQSAGEWLARTPAGPVKESATISYLETVAPYEPDVAAQWAATLPAGKQKSELNHIYEALKQKDQAAAEAFATRHGVDVRK